MTTINILGFENAKKLAEQKKVSKSDASINLSEAFEKNKGTLAKWCFGIGEDKSFKYVFSKDFQTIDSDLIKNVLSVAAKEGDVDIFNAANEILFSAKIVKEEDGALYKLSKAAYTTSELSKSDEAQPVSCDCGYKIDYMKDQLRWLSQDISSLWNYIYKHEEGHIPKIQSAEQLERAIKALGLKDEYTVQKKIVYASDGKADSFVLEVKGDV